MIAIEVKFASIPGSARAERRKTARSPALGAQNAGCGAVGPATDDLPFAEYRPAGLVYRAAPAHRLPGARLLLAFA
jgi:hypothetical protein